MVRWLVCVPQYWQVKLSRRKTSAFVSFTVGRGRFTILSIRMIEGAGNDVEIVLMVPRPFIIRVALFVNIKPSARRVVHTLRGSKFALSTKTGADNLDNIGFTCVRRRNILRQLQHYSIRPVGCYNRTMMLDLSSPQEFHPLIGNRRTELFAWILAIIMISTVWISPVTSGIGQLISFILVGFFSISAIFIFFGNWLDRHTSLTLTDLGIEYKNGIRYVRMDWAGIKEVRIFPSGKGFKVFVYNGSEHMSFQTLTEISTNGKVKIRYGFERGEEILEVILKRSNLRDVGKHHTGRYDYYTSE
jgi:hypothetical protein